MLPGRPRVPFDKVLLVGCGPSVGFDEAAEKAVVEAVAKTLEGLRLRSFVMSLPGRGKGVLGAAEAMRRFLAAASGDGRFDEVLVLDDPDALRAMVPVVEADRQRSRAQREPRDEEGSEERARD